MNLTIPKVVAVVDYLGLREREDCYKEFKLGSQLHKRYSQKAITEIKAALKKESADSIWEKQQGRKPATEARSGREAKS